MLARAPPVVNGRSWALWKAFHNGHGKLVKAWVAERADQLELFYLPSYSPQLNPEERLDADLKQEMGKRVPVRTKAKLRDAANEHMTMLEQCPARVIGYFQDRRVRYAD